MIHRQAPPNQMQPGHFMPNPQAPGGPNPWWGHQNRYAHPMGGMHQKDNVKPNEAGKPASNVFG